LFIFGVFAGLPPAIVFDTARRVATGRIFSQNTLICPHRLQNAEGCGIMRLWYL
jgi:hypothetical protein